MVTHKEYFKLKHTLLFWIVLLVGISFKGSAFLLRTTVFSEIYSLTNICNLLDYLGNIFIISFGIAIITQFFLKRGEEKTLREILGIAETTTLFGEISQMIYENDFEIEKRISTYNFKMEPGFNKMSMFHTDDFDVLVKKDNVEFNFRRGGNDSIKVQRIMIAKKGEPLKDIILSEHRQKTPCADLTLYSIIKFDFKKNQEYKIKIFTYGPDCMYFKKDFIRTDILYPQDKTKIILRFPKNLNKNYSYDSRLRGIIHFKDYIQEKSYFNPSKINRLVIEHNKKCFPGDMITVFYEEE